MSQPTKIIQITTATTNSGTIIVTALHSDGTIWWRSLMTSSNWIQVV